MLTSEVRSAETIASFAAKEDVDLLIVRTRGRRGAREILGSVAEAVVRVSTCPIMVVNPDVGVEGWTM